MAIIIIRTLVVYFALVVSMRLMGKRQLSELELPELAIAVLIADLAAHPLQSALEREISTTEIGEMVMKRLKDVDEVAYVRFASVYRSFKDINTFMEELTKLLKQKEN